MTAVCDTGPINYLVQIDHAWVLPRILGKLAIPPGVLIELNDPGTPASVRSFVDALPDWLTVEPPKGPMPEFRLGKGETEAIQLAIESRAWFISDDLQARKAARQQGLSVTGTVGILLRADRLGMIQFEAVLRFLVSSTNYFISETFIESLLRQSKDAEGPAVTGEN